MAENPRTPPMSQRQEDVLLELFLELSTEDRKKVIKLARDLARESQKAPKN